MQLHEAINTAIAFECKIRDLYVESAKRTQNAQGQRVFATLAKEEQGHVNYLEALKAKCMTAEPFQMPTLETCLPEPTWLQEEMARLAIPTATSDDAGSAFEAELAFLKEALALEHQAATMYDDLVSQLSDTYKSLFKRFLEIENGHLNIVQAEIDSLRGHGTWFDFTEVDLEASPRH